MSDSMRLDIARMRRVLEQIWAVRPVNRDDPDDAEQAAAWRAVQAEVTRDA